jgi:ABC-2 type transport system permease protein
VTGALLYLTIRSLRNRVMRRTAQLRRPRYLIVFVLGAAYVWAVFSTDRPRSLTDTPVVQSAELIGAIMLAGVAVWSWTFGSERRALAFSPAEVTFLFPAPLTRRALVHFKLARLQVLIVLNVAIWTFLLGGPRGLPVFQRAAALWVLLSTIALHRTGAALVRRSVAEHGTAGLRRRAVSLVLALVALAGAVSGLVAALPALATLGTDGGPALVRAADAAAAAPLASVLLAPFRLLVAPLTAPDSGGWARAIVPAFGLLAVHYVWVLRSDTAFEEAAAEWSLARARRGARAVSPRRAGTASPTLLPLAPVGRPAVALIWKNLARVFRRRRVRNVLLGFGAIALVVAVASLGGARGFAHGAGALALTWAGFALLLGPQWVRNDLRRDLRQLDVLRSYPLRGRSVVAAETAASTVSLTLIQYALVVVAWLAFLGESEGATTLAQRTVCLAAAMILLPPINYLALLLQNGAALLYPAWMSAVGDGAGGLEALGQNLLATAAFALLLLLLLLPPAGVGVLLLWAGGGGAVSLAAAAGAGLLVMVAEGVLLIRVLGTVYDGTDAATRGIKW